MADDRASIPFLGAGVAERLSRLEETLDSLDQGLQVIDREFRYVYLNAAVARHARRSRESLLGRTMMEAFPGIETTPLFVAIARCMHERVPATRENQFSFPDGRTAWFELRIEPCPEGVVVFSMDVDERKALEAQLRQSQKMDAVGRLAGGLAHDFNNLLSVILSLCSLLLEDIEDEDPHRGDVLEIQRAGHRAAELTRQLLAYSRQQVAKPRSLDLNRLLGEFTTMLPRLVGETVDVRVMRGSSLRRVRADPSHIEQIVLNLVVNARDAMPDGGTITIETMNVDIDESYVERHIGSAVGPHVVLVVSDTGEGMSPETIEHIFEPFFTTKEVGRGTGLGLSTVFGIVKQSGGDIWVYSEVGKGTTFKVYFPEAESGERTPDAPSRRVPPRHHHGNETILLVEDDHALRALLGSVLTKHGYRVLDAANGLLALEVAEREPKIDLLLTDVVMPAMMGSALAERLVRERPTLRVLFMSGYTENSIVHHRVVDPGVELIEKPLTPDALLTRVRSILDR